MKTFELQPFCESDIELLSPVMKRAFNADSQFHLGHDGGPAGYDDGSFLRQWALHPDATAFRLDIEKKPAGAVILWIKALYPETKEWRTETPGFARMNHHFYVNKCGFQIFKIENSLSFEGSSYQLRKIGNIP